MKFDFLGDVVVGPISPKIPLSAEVQVPMWLAVVGIMVVILLVRVISLAIAKKNKDEEMIEIYKDKVDSMGYSTIFVCGIGIMLDFISEMFLLAIIPFALALFSIICRLSDNKKISYVLLAVFCIVSIIFAIIF